MAFPTADCKVKFRVTKYDIEYGIPLGFRDFDRQAIASNPAWYWRIAGGDYTSYGTSSEFLSVINTTGSTRTSLAGYEETTLALHGASGFTTDLPGLSDEWAVSLLAYGTDGVIFSLENADGDWFAAYLSAGKLFIRNSLGLFQEIDSPNLSNRTILVGMSYRDGNMVVYVSGATQTVEGTPLPNLDLPFTLRLGCADQEVNGVVPVTSRPLAMEGSVERCAIYNSYIPLSVFTRLETMAVLQVQHSPSMQFDTTSVSLVSQSVDYNQYIEYLNPVHRYKLDGTWGSGQIDSGSGGVNATFAGPSSSDYPAPGNGVGKAIYGDGGTSMTTSARLFPDHQVATHTPGFTMLFWTLQGADRSRHSDDLLGFTDYLTGCGVYLAIKENRLNFHKKTENGTYAIEVPAQYLQNLEDISQITKDTWTLCAMTVDDGGYMRIYMDGAGYVSNAVATGSPGIKVGLTASSRFKIGHLGIFDTAPQQLFSDVMFFDRCLSVNEINNIYTIGRYGKGFANSSLLPDGEQFDDYSYAYKPTTDPLPGLTNPTPVLGLSGFDAVLSIDQLIESAALYATPDTLREYDLENMLKVGDYVVIEQCATKLDGTSTSEWIPIGHYVVESPFRPDESVGTARWTLSLRTTTKFLSEPLVANRFIVPDIISHRKVPLKLQVTNADELRFQALRSDGTPYRNWSEYPTPVIEVSNFRNLSKPDDSGGDLPSGEIPPKINVRGQKDSVDIDTRTGTIRINRNFYEDAIGKGLGDPDPDTGLVVTFDRYRTYQDKADRQIQSISSDSGAWELGIADPPTIQGKCTMYVETGAAASKVFELYDPSYSYDDEESTDNRFTACTQASDGNIAWGASPSYNYLIGRTYMLNGGPPSAALQRDGYSAYTVPNVYKRGEKTNTLKFSGIARYASNPTKRVVGITIIVHRWAVMAITVGQTTLGLQPYRWAGNQAVDQYKAILTINDVEVGSNYGPPGIVKPVVDSNSGVFWYESQVYGGDTDLWGLPEITAETLQTLGFNLQAIMNVDTSLFKIGVDGVDVRVKYDDGTSIEKKYRVLDIDGGFVNPTLEGLAVGDTVRIGNVNSPDKVLGTELLRVGFQRTDPTRPFYFATEDVPEALEAAVPPTYYSYEQQAKPESIVGDALSYLPPSFMLLQKPDGHLQLQNIIQEKNPELTEGDVMSFAVNTSDRGVYTQLLAHSVSGESIDVLSIGNVAIRAYKMDNVADGTLGSSSAYGRTYANNASEYQALNSFLAGLFDNSYRTPAPSGNGWKPPASWGVLYAQNGSHVWPWAMEEQPLFVIDLGQLADGVEYSIEALKMVVLDSYFDGEKIPEQLQFYYMDAQGYAIGSGKFPPPNASQAAANQVTSYMPEVGHPGWKVLTDALELSGEVTIEQDQFRFQKPVKIRFLKVVGINPQYRRGNASSDKQARYVISDLRAYTSREIVATATLGVTGAYNTPHFRQLQDRLRLRAYVLQANGYLDTYSKAKQFAADNLGELVRDIVPASVSLSSIGHTNGATIKFYSPLYNKHYTGVVQSVKVSESGVTTMSLVDYNAEWFNV